MHRSQAVNLRDKLQTYLDKFGEEHNLSLTVGSGSMTSSTVTFKVELAEVSESGQVLSRERENFARYASTYGLAAGDLDKTFNRDGLTYKIVGLLRNSHKYPVLCEVVETQRRIKFSSDTIKYLLQKNI